MAKLFQPSNLCETLFTREELAFLKKVFDKETEMYNEMLKYDSFAINEAKELMSEHVSKKFCELDHNQVKYIAMDLEYYFFQQNNNPPKRVSGDTYETLRP